MTINVRNSKRTADWLCRIIRIYKKIWCDLLLWCQALPFQRPALVMRPLPNTLYHCRGSYVSVRIYCKSNATKCFWVCYFNGRNVTALGLSSFFKKIKKINGASFRHLQPMAELRRKQRGEIGRQRVKVHSCSHFSPCFDHTSSPQTDDGTSQIHHDIGAYVPYSFRAILQVLLRPLPTEVQGWRRQGQRLNVTAQWRDHLNWERAFTARMISTVF